MWHTLIKAAPIPDQPTDRLSADMFFNNYGKSPAINRIGKGKIFFGPNALNQALQWFEQFGKRRFITDETGTATVDPPGKEPSPDPDKPHGDFTTMRSDTVPTAQDVIYIREHDDSMVIVHRMEYFDLSGNFYWSEACWRRLITGAWAGCRKHNELH